MQVVDIVQVTSSRRAKKRFPQDSLVLLADFGAKKREKQGVGSRE
jgi:hypothetical protein